MSSDTIKTALDMYESFCVAVQQAGGDIQSVSKLTIKDFLTTAAMNGIEVACEYIGKDATNR